jgi:hypothetical protein
MRLHAWEPNSISRYKNCKKLMEQARVPHPFMRVPQMREAARRAASALFQNTGIWGRFDEPVSAIIYGQKLT